MITYSAREREATTIPIEAFLDGGEIRIFPEIQGKGYFDIRLRGKQLTLTAGKFVGLIPLNDKVLINVQPKIPIPNLLRILSKAQGKVVEIDLLERAYKFSAELPDSIMDVLVGALIFSLQQVETEGLRKEYQGLEESGPFLKGQIRFQDSAQRFWSHGHRHIATSAFYDLVSDTRENRVLLYACRLLLTQYRLTSSGEKYVSALAHFEELFLRSGVREVGPTGLSFDRIFDGLPPTYQQALRVAKAILSNQGVELPVGGSDVQLSSLVIDLETLFEAYTRRVLADRIGNFGVLDGNREGAKPLFDDRPNPQANPDIVIGPDGGRLLVGEVKYKASEGRDDINQVLAYAMSYKVPQIVLFLPTESQAERGLAKVGEVGGVGIFRYKMNLSATDLAEEETAMTDSIRSLLAPAPVAFA